ASTTRITTVRMKVAKSLPTFSTPISPKIAVSAANAADIRAQACQGSACMAVLRGLGPAIASANSTVRPRSTIPRLNLSERHGLADLLLDRAGRGLGQRGA